MTFNSWVRQPTTITGISTFVGGITAGVLELVYKMPGASATIGAAVFGAMHLLINDNTAVPPSGPASP